jgi:dTDP-4-dehydrorhamnose reductase
MRVLITGSGGQLAGELERRAPTSATIMSVSRAECDITDSLAVERRVGEFHPDAIINTAAYTAVDLAEEARDEAFTVNAQGARNVAAAATRIGARVIQISTDYVFDGLQSTPYAVNAKPNPLSVYGASKLEGERAVMEARTSATIVRAGWLYSAKGKNFFRTILGRLSQTAPLRVVNDQVGVPTSARELADFLWWLTENPSDQRIMHWANSGEGSWYDFAVAIAELADSRGLIDHPTVIEPIATAALRPAQAARRPDYSVLDAKESWLKYGRAATHWRDALASTLDELQRFPQ